MTTRHPLREYLAAKQAEWEALPAEQRESGSLIDRWLIKFAGVEDTPLHRAWSRKWLLAAVRRARKPGAKFDQILVLESEEGWNKSGLFEALASTPWFDENLKLGMSAKEVLEQMEGKWIGECAELQTSTNKEVEHVKQFASRTHDRAAKKYDAFATDRPRSFVIAGTTNNAQYLRSKNGNRRCWPMTITKRINIEAVKAVRDLLWGEAAHYEAQGESLALSPELYAAAAEAQAAREIVDPIEDLLGPLLHDRHGRISIENMWLLLGQT
jgi:predicted P-loop ATPase